MEDKVTSLHEAAALVERGCILALGGMTLYRRPVALVWELLRSEPRPTNLTLLCFTASYESDLLIGAGMVSAVRSCYFGLEVFGLAPMFTEAANEGTINVIEETEASLSFGMRAHLANVSFMPGYAWIGTDLPHLRPDVQIIEDPYNPGQKLVAFPAISWDVAVIHALQADRRGNARLNANSAVDGELALGATEHVIITAEEIVEDFHDRVEIPGAVVSAVVHAPHGAWPTSCYPHYPLGGNEILRYIDSCNRGEFSAYVADLNTIESRNSH